MEELQLTPDEVASLTQLVSNLARRFRTATDPALIENARVYSCKLPDRVLYALNRIRVDEPESGAILISGFPVDQQRLGATPADWVRVDAPSPAHEQEILIVLLGAVLGDMIGWTTQQSGRLIHDVFPIRRYEHEQLGMGSSTLLTWHTEDAFHPHRGDYLALLCLRNPNQAATTLGNLVDVNLSPRQLELLCQPLYTIRPDESHQEKNRVINGANGDSNSYQEIQRMTNAPDRIPVLFGSPDSPYLRLDPYFMDSVEDTEAQQALDSLTSQIDATLNEVVLQAGDVLFVDNYRAVHGRRPFKARFDGTDRWLKRVNLVRDLRKSSAARDSIRSRVLI